MPFVALNGDSLRWVARWVGGFVRNEFYFSEFPYFLLHLLNDDIPSFAIVFDVRKAQRLADVDGDLVRPGKDSAGRAGFKGTAQVAGDDGDIAAGHQHAHARFETEIIAVARPCAFGEE